MFEVPENLTPYSFPEKTPFIGINPFPFHGKRMPLTPKPEEYKFILNDS
jgi:hypothetical protein